MANILILGAGAMGTAFAYPCIDNNHKVNIVGTHLENNTIDELTSKHFHPGLNLKVPEKINFFKYEFIKNAFKLSILTLTNTVSSALYGFDFLSFLDLNNFTKMSLILFMILGKIEIIAVIYLIKRLIFRD